MGVSAPKNRDGEALCDAVSSPALGVGERESTACVGVTLGVDWSNHTVGVGVGACSALGVGEVAALALALGSPLPQALELGEGVCVPLPLELRERRGEREGVELPLGLGVALLVLEERAVAVAGEAEAEAVAAAEGVCVAFRTLGLPLALGDTEGEAVAEAVPLAQALLPALRLPCREALLQALTLALAEGEGVEEAEAVLVALRVLLALPCLPLRVGRGALAVALRLRAGGAEVVAEGAMETETKGASVLAAVAVRWALGEAVCVGWGSAVCAPLKSPAEAAVRPAPVTLPTRSRPVLTAPLPPLLLLLLPMSTSAEWPCSPNSSCLGTPPPSAAVAAGSKACAAHRARPVVALSANMAPLLPRQASVPLPSDAGGSRSERPGGSAKLHAGAPLALSRAVRVCTCVPLALSRVLHASSSGEGARRCGQPKVARAQGAPGENGHAQR